MEKKDILEQINKAKTLFSVVGKPSIEKIAEYENKIGLNFPETYRWFLREYGAGGIGSVDILGIDPDDYSDVLSYTKDKRQNGLEHKYIPIFDCDEFIYCIDTEDKQTDGSTVIRWDISSKKAELRANNFIDFLYEEFERVLNLDN